MMGIILSSDDTSAPFDNTIGLKQGFVLASVLFNLFSQVYWTMLCIDSTHVVYLRYRLDGSLFDLRRLIQRTRALERLIRQASFTDDYILMAYSEHNLQTIISSFAKASCLFGHNHSQQDLAYTPVWYRISGNSSQHKYRWHSAEISQPLQVFGKCNLFWWHSWQGDRGLNQQGQSILGDLCSHVINHRNITLIT